MRMAVPMAMPATGRTQRTAAASRHVPCASVSAAPARRLFSRYAQREMQSTDPHNLNNSLSLSVCAQQVNGDGLSLALSNSDLDTLKAEIVREMRLEIQKVKNEIIDGELRDSLLFSLHI